MSATEQARPLLTIAETAEHLAVSERTVRRLIDRQEIPALRIGSSIRVDQAELQAWLYEDDRDDAA